MLHHEKIYKVADASGELNEEHGHPTNVRPLDLSITKSVLGIIGTALLMFFLFTGLAKSYGKNGGIAKGAGRFLNHWLFTLEMKWPFLILEKRIIKNT